MLRYATPNQFNASGSVALQLFLFGPPYIVHGKRPLVVARLQIRLLLYRLGILEPVPREELAFLLWSDVPDVTARRNLSQLLSHLRRALPDKDLLLTTHNHVQLDPQRVWSDVAAFHLLTACEQPNHREVRRKAIELYRGPLLEGVSAPENAEWEGWLFNERQVQEHRYLDALTTLVHDATACGAYEEGIELARRYLAVDELAEEMHRRLIELHVANGDRSAALLQYERCVAVLERELGVGPMPETRAAYDAARIEHPTNLPVPLTPLIGREQELAQVVALLRQEETWLVTLTGSGGTGKTRLSLEVASRLLPAFAHGVFFVSLAPLRDPSLVLSTIVQTLGVQEVQGQSMLEQLKSYLREKHLLLVMDNFEHVLDAAPLLTELRSIAPHLTILATSRERLRLRGEKCFLVPPLALPDETTTSLGEVAEVEAIRLFVERARDVRLDFALAKHNSTQVTEICRRLDGLPLAIELVAAQCYTLSVQTILDSLSPVLRFETEGPRDLPARQQTLCATIAWSYDLLNQTEKQLFRRLAVFAGSCTQESAEIVCGVAGEPGQPVHIGLTALADKSLLRHVPRAGGSVGPRFELLETIREFALERLDESGEAEKMRKRHRAYYLALLRNWADDWSHTRDRRTVTTISSEAANIRAAWHWMLAKEHWDGASEVLENLYTFFLVHNWYQEGEQAFAAAAERLRGLGQRAEMRGLLGKARARQGAFCLAVGQYQLARDLVEESLDIAHACGAHSEIGLSLLLLGSVARWQGAVAEARRLHQQALHIFRSLKDDERVAQCLIELGETAEHMGEFQEAKEHFAASLALTKELGYRDRQVHAFDKLGAVSFYLGEYVASEHYYQKSLACAEEVGDRLGAAMALGGLGWSAWAKGGAELQKAMDFIEQSLLICREIGHQLHVASRLTMLGYVAHSMGDPIAQERYGREGLAVSKVLKNPIFMTAALANMGEAALSKGELATARRYLCEALTAAVSGRAVSQGFHAVIAYAALLRQVVLRSKIAGPKQQEMQELAIELLALASHHRGCWKIVKDRAISLLSEIADGLPQEVVDAAAERGKRRAFEEMAAMIEAVSLPRQSSV